MMKRLTVYILFSIVFSKVYAQVNLQTGSATFSLPMFSWQDDKSRLNSMVALSYNSGSGLRVNDIASNAGQGWNLIAGGEIVRLQAGEPDDQVARPGSGEFDITRYPPGILYATVPATNGCPEALTRYPIYGWKNQLYAQLNKVAEDKELDYFSFQFNGKAGMFVLDPSNLGVAKSLGDTKMIITFQTDPGLDALGIRTNITSFTIKDVDGLIYKFTKHGLTKVLKTEFSDDSFNHTQTAPKFKNGKVYYQAAFDNMGVQKPWIIGSWHLTEIEEALTHRKIFFNYVTKNVNNIAGYDISTYRSNKDYSIVSRKTSITQSPEISSVVYPDGHITTINYGNSRFDLNGQQAISSVDVTYQGRYLSKYELNTTYFILNRYGTPVTDYQKSVSRLCLRSVRKIGIDLKEDTPPYIFDYYTGSNLNDDFVPPPFFYAKDIFGFYNGDNSKGYWNETIPLNTTINTIKNYNQLWGLCFRRNNNSNVILNAKSGYAKNGLLKQIIYPTAGTLTYQYEQNTGVVAGSPTNVGGVHVAQTSSTDGGFSNNCANPIITNYNFVMNGTGSASSLWGLETPVNKIESHNYYKPESKHYKYSWSCIPLGCCDWRFKNPGILSQQQAVNLAGWQKAMEALSPVMGILSIFSTIKDIATVVGGGSPVALIIDAIVSIFQVAITCIGNQDKNFYSTIYVNADLNSAAPLPVQFKRVEVTESPGTIGKTIQEFTSEDDYPIWETTNPVYSAKQRFAPWAYGLPKTTTVLDANGYKIKESLNSYDFFFSKSLINPCIDNHGLPCNSSGIQSALVSCKCEVNKTSSQRSVDWNDPATYNPGYLTASGTDMKVDFYGMYTGRTLLINTTEKIFKPNSSSEFAETSTKYWYNNGESNSNYEVYEIETTQSNGDKSLKNFKYSGNYSGGALSTLVQNNILSQPISTFTTTIKAGDWQQRILSENVTEFIQLANGDIKPNRVLEQRFSEPALQNTVTLYQGPNGSTSYYKIPQQFTYDVSGNLIGVKDEGNRSISNIYDYDDKYVIATVINADPVTDKTAYTSFETTSNGKWVLSGVASYASNTSITGSRSFSLSSGKSFTVSALNTSKPHTVSFWSTTSGITVTGGATLTKSAPTINGFTFYEYNISTGTSAVTVAGNGIIDELRLYPSTARMRSTTYDPLIGKTSECDENNRITYYEYDNLGRLRFIKDEKKNIVKMNEYNNISASKQNGCPGIYYNRLISENFIKNNCSSGYIGAEVTFTVPANSYSSALSQQDADAQAEVYLLTNGQAYANANGVCSTLYYNAVQSQNFVTENCQLGNVGGAVTYTVPAGRYYSLESQADANQKALDEIDANGEAYANTAPNAVCVPSYGPLWSWLEGASYYCQNVNGELHLFVLETDINPNSSTYNQTRWSDVGTSDLCSTISYFNTVQSQVFTRNNCTGCSTGSQVTCTVLANTYGSSVSVAAANQLALANIAAYGQSYANANGSCVNGSSIPIIYNNTAGVSGYKAKYTNTSTNAIYIFNIPSSGTGIIGCVPSGTYSLTIYKTPHGFAPLLLFGNGCQYVSGGYSGSFSNVDVGYCYYATIDADL